jgi:hypothetical protein
VAAAVDDNLADPVHVHDLVVHHVGSARSHAARTIGI